MTPDEFDRLPMQVQQSWELVWLWKLKPGDEHPTRKGWFLQSELGNGLEPLWYRPPHPVETWFVKIVGGAYVWSILIVGIGGLATAAFIAIVR